MVKTGVESRTTTKSLVPYFLWEGKHLTLTSAISSRASSFRSVPAHQAGRRRFRRHNAASSHCSRGHASACSSGIAQQAACPLSVLPLRVLTPERFVVQRLQCSCSQDTSGLRSPHLPSAVYSPPSPGSSALKHRAACAAFHPALTH